MLYGHRPSLYDLQIFYYSGALALLVLGLGYMTCAVVVFFRDLSQLIVIILQVGVWLTPIMWRLEILPPPLQKVMMLNPLYYIVTGYRDALVNKQWFWEHGPLTIYFWAFTLILFMLGARVFSSLKVHFSDVL